MTVREATSTTAPLAFYSKAEVLQTEYGSLKRDTQRLETSKRLNGKQLTTLSSYISDIVKHFLARKVTEGLRSSSIARGKNQHHV